jgi:hypothetical protein
VTSLQPLPGGFLRGRRRPSGLPEGREPRPLTGVKLAGLGLERPYDLSTVHYVGVRPPFGDLHDCDDTRCYGRTAHAVCAAGEAHEAPGESCQCGFYAFRPDAPLGLHLEPRAGQWLLDVRLSGKVVVHEHGYRAQHQRVVGISPPTRCACQQGAPTIVLAQGRTISAVCVTCAAEAVARHGALVLRASRLEELLGVPLRRRNLADEWLELLESGLLTRQADPTVPALADQELTVRVRDGESGIAAQVRTDRSDVLGRWLLQVVSDPRFRRARIEVARTAD